MARKKELRKVDVHTMVRIDAYRVISCAVEEGVKYGLRRAHKHDIDPPSETELDAVAGHVEDAVKSSLFEVLIFDDEPQDVR